MLVPHFKDEYWLSVAYGLEQRAAELGLSLRFFEAGGYDALQTQVTQLSECADLDPGAILIGAVSSDAPALLVALDRAAEAHPVIGLVNELHSDALVARIGVDWAEMGRLLGQSLAARFPAGGPMQQAILLSGPAEAGWVAPTEQGLRAGLDGSAITITATYGADTGTAEQLRLLEQAWAEHPQTDLVIGSAPAIEGAMALFRAAPTPGPCCNIYEPQRRKGLVGARSWPRPSMTPSNKGGSLLTPRTGRSPAASDSHRSVLRSPSLRLASRRRASPVAIQLLSRP
ncbi:TMAO reductase system periplasmic protein TorT [Gemmobacter lanyuensis]